MTDTKQNISLFTHRADRALAMKVERITGKTDSFATNFMGRVEDEKDPTCTRLVAVRDLDTNLWEIKRQTRLGGDARGMTRHTTEAQTGLCFFDALHYLARFQTTEADLGKQPCDVIGKVLSTLQHYTEAAEDAGQAIDADGEVHPCINGQIMTDGFFDNAAIAIAEKTKGQNLPALPQTYASGFVGILNNKLMQNSVGDSDHTDLAVQSVDRLQQINKFKKVIKLTEEFSNRLERVILRNFKPSSLSGEIYFGAISLGVIPAIQYIKAAPSSVPVRSITRALNNMNGAIAVLPDCTLKPLMQEFTQAAAYAIAMERAACIYDICKEGEKSSRAIDKALQKGLPLIDEAASVIGLGQTDRERLRADYLAGKVVKNDFKNHIKNIWGGWHTPDSLCHKLNEHIRTLENNGPN